MATSYDQLVQDVSSMLHSYTGLQERLTWLTGSVDITDLDIAVQDSNKIRVGINEIGDELVYVASTNEGAATIAPFGRGFHGSTAVAHSTNDMVTADPLFPRHDIKRAVTQTLAQVFPDLYQVKTTEFTFNAPQLSYELPADVEMVLEVSWDVIGPTQLWQPIYHWALDEDSDEATGKAINLMELAEQGRTVRVVYLTRFGEFVSGASLLEDIGFPESAADVLTYGAAHRLIRFMDVARLQGRSTENIARASTMQPGDASKIANQIFAFYQQRLAEERSKLLRLHPPRMNFTG